MKYLGTFVLFFLFIFNTLSQIPYKISYQAIIRDSNNELIANQQIGIQISIINGSAEGDEVYVETQNPTTNENGLIAIEIGNGAVLKGDLSIIDWADGQYFIKTDIDPTTAGGTNYTISGISQLVSVPYAMHAKEADELTGEANESDPIFTAWDKSTGILISESQIIDFTNFVSDETDPVFTAWDKSEGIEITESQITDLGAYLDTETDPAFAAWDKSEGITITESQISDFGVYIYPEVDPEFTQSAAFEITSTGSGEVITNAERTNLQGIEDGAQKNVKSNWNASSSNASILNKPTNLGDFNNDIGLVALTENPSAGDIIYFNGSNWTKLSKGNPGQLVAINAEGNIVWGNSPVATTTDPKNTINETAILTGIVNPSGLETTITFEYGTTTDYGNTVVADHSQIEGSEGVEVTASISGLTIGETYHFRVKAENALSTTYGNDKSFTVELISIGDEYAGGIVAYFFQPGDYGYVEGETRGIVAATSNTTSPTHSKFGCYGTSIPTSVELGYGMENTIAIASVCFPAPGTNESIAAHECLNFVHNGFDDWHLPSRNELNKVYEINHILNMTDRFWSSSQVNSMHAYMKRFLTGETLTAGKSIQYRIRPVRYF